MANGQYGNLNFTYSSAPMRTVQEVQFGLLSPEEIKGMSVRHILYPETMDDMKQRPREYGLNDPRLGTIDRGVSCGTCGEDIDTCPGHFGHIELATPVFHVGFIRKIQKVLEMVCHNCGKLLTDDNNPAFIEAKRKSDPKRKFEAIWRVCKPKRICELDPTQEEIDIQKQKGAKLKIPHGGCGNLQPEIRKEGLKLMGTYKQSKEDDGNQPEKMEIKASTAERIFKTISDEEIMTIGLNKDYARPEWMVISMLPVPPPPVRPSISVDGTGQGMRGEDDLTYKLGDIIRANSNVRRCQSEGSPQHVLDEFEELLQYHVATFMDNNIAGLPQALQKSGRPLKTIRGRLKGKEGRLRGNLMGKRVDFSARTVITGDPNLSLDEVGVPRSIARTLTYPETVTPYNIQHLSKLVRNGPEEHPGARFVIRSDGQRINLRIANQKKDIGLEYGWKVERHIVDGDFIIFNRQPSLHKESMMGHRVRVMPYSTFRLNLSVTSPYNADFDGDEMNLHVPQSHETRAEVMELCMVPKNIVSPQRNGPLMGIVQDTLCGAYKMSRRDVFLTKEQVMNILLWVPEWDGIIPQPAIIKPRPKWTGKQIISLVLPDNLNLSHVGGDGAEAYLPLKEANVLIHGGELMFGLFTKKVVGATGGGIVHIIYNELGWEAAVKFFNGCQRVVNYWFLHNGFSIGIGDTIPDATTRMAIEAAVAEQKQEVEEIVDLATKDELEALPGMGIRETFESKVAKALNTARDVAGGKTEENLKTFNNALQMAKSGSKGSTINIAQMAAVVGQQSVEGKRIPFGFKYRSLPHFTKDDYSPESRGFVENSYLRGLTPSEFFFHAMAGREGLIDTAVKTAETGYIQRRLVKALEDVMAKYDGTVRNSLGDIVQFVYGEDGLDAMYIEKQSVDSILTSSASFEAKFRIDVTSDNAHLNLSPAILEQATEIRGDAEVQDLFDQEWDQLCKDRAMMREHRFITSDTDSNFQLPLNVIRIIQSAKDKFRIKDGSRSDLHPAEVIPRVREMLDRLVVVRGEDEISRNAQHDATMLFKAQLRSRLAFKRLVSEHSMNKLAFENILGDIENRFARALVCPGEMVGVLAAQSIGEPATQMTLNTFHFAGVSSKNVTLGVPRLKEILNVATNIKTPSMMVYQKGEARKMQDSAKDLRSKVEHTVLRSVTEATEIYYDPEIQSTIIEADMDMVESYFIIPDDTMDDPSQQSKWLLRVVLSRRKLLDKGLTVSDVAAKIKETFGKDMAIIFSDNNADEQVIRCRLNNQDNQSKDDEEKEGQESDLMLKRLESHMLDNLTLRGVTGVDRAFITKEDRTHKLDDGSLIKRKGAVAGQEWYLDTTGTAFAAVLAIEGVDTQRTYSNSFIEIFEVLGIEATRSALGRELFNVLSFDGSYVNHRHLALLVDVMTARGHLMAITRHGINRAETGALMRCSFEETVEILLEAAACGEIDDCRGISENIMLGQMAPLGTGELEVLLDQNMLNTSTNDNARFGLMPQVAAAAGAFTGENGGMTPYDLGSPSHEGGFGGPDYGASFSPMVQAGGTEAGGFTSYGGGGGYSDGSMSPFHSGGTSPYGARSPFAAASPLGAASPGWSPASPLGYSPNSPANGTSPMGRSPMAASPLYDAASPTFSPARSPGSPSISPASPTFSPNSPAFSPSSPSHRHVGRRQATSPEYSPASPLYSPASPAWAGGTDRRSPNQMSPRYNPSPTSPGYSPQSPTFSPASPNALSPGSPHRQLSPGSPRGASPRHGPGLGRSAVYSPGANSGLSPQSPQWTPSSPDQSPNS